MIHAVSPLRYPGGKVKLYSYVKDILTENDLIGSATYVEPFAGGAGLAIKLLLNNDVKKIILNDLDPAIYCFWIAVLNHTDEFCHLIDNANITVDEWARQKAIYKRADTSDLLGFAFSVFFLNRTNVSGVLNAGIIGGLNQSGAYKIDARFNKERLKELIYKIAQSQNKITILNMDANTLISSSILSKSRKTLIFFDPPYVNKGARLYQNFFNENDHIVLSKSISRCKKKWITTYDTSELIENLYSGYQKGKICLNYSVQKKKREQELVFFSHNLKVPTKFLNNTFHI